MTPSVTRTGRAADASTPARIFRPGPGYRLAFVSIPRFLQECLAFPIGDDFRTARPLVFRPDDFHRPFLGPDEIGVLNQFKALKKQVEWMAGRYAAKHLARLFLPGRPSPADTRVAYRTKGAPYFRDDPSVSLSISHSRDYAAAGLGLRPSCILGLDLEYIRPGRRQLLLQTAFSMREVEILADRDDTALYLQWTAKEAYLKYIGMGFHESLRQVEILDDAIWHHGRRIPSLMLHRHIPVDGYAFSMVF